MNNPSEDNRQNITNDDRANNELDRRSFDILDQAELYGLDETVRSLPNDVVGRNKIPQDTVEKICKEFDSINIGK